MVGTDLIAVPVGPTVEMAAVGAPDYFARRGVPMHPSDLDAHDCLVLRFGATSAPYDWEFERAGEEITRKVTGPFLFNESELCVDAAREGFGIAYVTLPEVADDIESGRLQRVLTDWCEPFDGFQLCYSSRRQMSTAQRLLIDRLRYRPTEN
ncbi:hypothetical protein FJU08_21800 [Martelella alba]|uniref:LysR substrate-binding domain-containing protein n=2 Tax=Martelella alba TaxID=2590451 RepID=A0A506TZX1_9HYPH|nr:hypothetical protein FJU08_21800 [Martelella alba]